MKTIRNLSVFLIALGILGLTLFLWRISTNQIQSNLLKGATVTSEQFRQRFEAYVRERTVALQGMRSYWKVAGRVSREDFVRLSADVLTQVAGLRSILFVRPDLTVGWSHPERGLEATGSAGPQGLHPEILLAVRDAEEGPDGPTFSRVLAFPGKGKGFAICLPLSGKDGRLGTLAAVFEFKALLEDLFKEAVRNRYGIELRDPSEDEPVLRLLDENAERDFDPRYEIVDPIHLGDQELLLKVHPYAIQSAAGANAPGLTILSLGTLLALVIAGVLWRMGSHQESLEEMVEARTAELKRSNDQLAHEHRRALEATRLKSEFLANVTHELKSPMHSILTLSELLGRHVSGGLNLEQQKQVDMIYGSGQDLLGLITGVLDFSKIEAGKMDVRVLPFDLRALIRSVVESVDPQAASKGLDIAVSVSDALPDSLFSDEPKVRQILSNLVENAIKFTPEKGRVTVEAVLANDARPVWVEMTVRDTGVGIDPEDHAAIFDAFRQLDGSFTRRYGGTGLGLAIAKSLVELLGGRIWVESQLGAGAAFRFTFPAARPDDAEAPSA